MNRKELILSVLSGKVTPQTHAHLFDDDVVLFAVRQLEKEEPGWLVEQVKRPKSKAGGASIMSCLTPALLERVLPRS